MPDNKFIKVEDTEIVLEKGKERKKNILCVSPDIPSIFPIVKLFKEYNPILISAGEHLDIQENGCICLRKIHDLLDNSIVNKILAPTGFTPPKRKIFLSHLLRAESLKYANIPCRKYLLPKTVE